MVECFGRVKEKAENMDPRTDAGALENRRDPRSDLMKAKAKNSQKNTVNACPFGCQLEDLDDQGYCHHLVGFTCWGPQGEDKKMMEVFEPPQMPYPEGSKNRNLLLGHRCVNGKKRVPIPKGAQLVKITVCSRVYDPKAVDWRTEETKQLMSERRPQEAVA